MGMDEIVYDFQRLEGFCLWLSFPSFWVFQVTTCNKSQSGNEAIAGGDDIKHLDAKSHV